MLNGAKTFTTHGGLAGITVVMAVTDPGQWHHGISAFVVEQGTSGMIPGRKENKLGMRASDTAEVRFEDCHVSTDALLGAASQGFVNALEVLDAGRIGIAALSVGLGRARSKPRVGTRQIVGSSVSRLRPFRPFSGRSPKWQLGLRPPDC